MARLYRWAEYLCYGPILQRVRTHLIAAVGASRKALVLGDGDGRFLAKLLACNTMVEVCAVDTSHVMLQLLRRRCRRYTEGMRPRLRTVQGSATETAPARATDLVVTHFFLDCLSPPELLSLTEKLASQLLPGALWLVSDFDLPRSPLLRPLGQLYLRCLYAVFRVLTGLRVTSLPPIEAALARAGFVRIRRCEFAAGMLYTELWQLRAPANLPERPAPGIVPER